MLAALTKIQTINLADRPRKSTVLDVTHAICTRSYSRQVVMGATSALLTFRARDEFTWDEPRLRICCELQYVEPAHHDAETLEELDDTWEVTPRTNLRVLVYDTEGRVVAVGDQTMIKVGKSAPVTGTQVNIDLCPAGELGEILVIAGNV